jgi:hypothetical protein
MYIIELKKKNSNHFILERNSIRYEISKFMFFVMFKMKYLINRMQCNILSKQVR